MLITSVVFDVTKSVITELTASVSALRAFEQNRARAGVEQVTLEGRPTLQTRTSRYQICAKRSVRP